MTQLTENEKSQLDTFGKLLITHSYYFKELDWEDVRLQRARRLTERAEKRLGFGYSESGYVLTIDWNDNFWQEAQRQASLYLGRYIREDELVRIFDFGEVSGTRHPSRRDYLEYLTEEVFPKLISPKFIVSEYTAPKSTLEEVELPPF